MSTVMARRVASTPVRTAVQTWAKVVEIIAPDPQSAAREELARAAGVACAAIASEATKDAAFVVWGEGPRLRIYNVFDEDAITGDGLNEDPVSQAPTEGNWRLSIPCQPDDVAWSSAELASVSKRISVRALDEDVEDGADEPRARASTLGINLREFMKS
jgi:hypothetical protein